MLKKIYKEIFSTMLVIDNKDNKGNYPRMYLCGGKTWNWVSSTAYLKPKKIVWNI